MLSPGHIQFWMIIQSARVGMEKSQEDAGQLKNLRFRLVARNFFSLGLSIGRLSKLDVICSGDRGRGSDLTQAATMSINARNVVSQTLCIKKDKNGQAPAQP
jgi:hypothetical protein